MVSPSVKKTIINNANQISGFSSFWQSVRHSISKIEDSFAAFLIFSLALLPLLNTAIRRMFDFDIPFSSVVIQHLTLWICFIGATISTRRNEELSLIDLGKFLPQKFQSITNTLVFSVSTGILFLMTSASYNMIVAEMNFGKAIGGVPIWIAEVVILAGYGIILYRFLVDEKTSYLEKFIGIAILAGIYGLVEYEYISYEFGFYAGLIILIISAFFKVPIFVILGGIALIAFWSDWTVLSAFPIEIYSKIALNPSLPALPLFTLAGCILAEGGASKRLVNLFHNLFGFIPGGIAIATIAVCTFFTTFTGASGVTILAMGSLLKPALDEGGYQEKTSLGLITGSSSLGVLFPPSLPIILYGAIALQPIPDMFMGALLPGLLLVGITIAYGVYRGKKEAGKAMPFNRKKALSALWEAKYEAVLPFVVLIVLMSGYATLVETAALTALYAFVSEFVIHKDLKIRKDAINVLSFSTVLIGGVLIILASALGLTNYMVDASVPTMVLDFVQEHVQSKYVFLLYLNLFLFVAGCVMDVFTAIVIISPLLIPIAQAFQLNPVHVGIVFLANLSVGYLTPPVGMNLFIASYRFKKPLTEIYRACLPILLLLVIGVIIITYVPWLSTAIVDYFGGPTNVNIKMN